MKTTLQALSFLSLGFVIVAAIFYASGKIEKDLMKQLLLAGTLGWFLTAPFWIGRASA